MKKIMVCVFLSTVLVVLSGAQANFFSKQRDNQPLIKFLSAFSFINELYAQGGDPSIQVKF